MVEIVISCYDLTPDTVDLKGCELSGELLVNVGELLGYEVTEGLGCLCLLEGADH